MTSGGAGSCAPCICARATGAHVYTTLPACVPALERVAEHTSNSLCRASFCLLPVKKNKKQIKQYLTSQNHSLRKQLYRPSFFCFVRIFFFSSRQQQRELKKSPHCSIVHIVSFFALEQRLFAAHLGTQWCSHKNEPLSSHTKLQIAKHCRGESSFPNSLIHIFRSLAAPIKPAASAEVDRKR